MASISVDVDLDDKNNNYVEAFVGLENIFKIFRVDFVAGYANGKKGLSGIRIGTGGVIGGNIRRDANRSVSISL